MDSFFFNITDKRYKTEYIYKNKNNYIKRVDISNGIVFLDISLSQPYKTFSIKYMDRMVFIPVVFDGAIKIDDKISNQTFHINSNKMPLFCSSHQNLLFDFYEKQTNVFMLFIADFYLKRYLSTKEYEPIDFLYNKLQQDISLILIDEVVVDALSLYLIDKNIKKESNQTMQSLKKEHTVIEFFIHRLSLIDFLHTTVTQDDKIILEKAKSYLLGNFVNPPTIKQLAHICATNETKLKNIFKQVYKITIYQYIQKLKMEKANVLLKERVLNISEVAKEVGYKHQGHFSKLFFEYFGIYPKQLTK